MAGDKGFSPLCAAGDEFRPGPLVTAGPAARTAVRRRAAGGGRTRGGGAILWVCVPSGCSLLSRADLPSLARLPLVSRGVFIAGDHHPRGFRSEEETSELQSPC